MKIIKRNSSASSWGFLYSYVTQFLGFKSDADEGKVMGLAAYGNPKVKVFPFINFKKVIPELDLVGFSNYFRNMKPRKPGEPIGEFHKNLAATLQNSLDEVVLKMVKYLYRINGVKNFCIAGGVGLNCTTNGKIWNSPYVDSIFIQPANNDAGTALGSPYICMLI